MSTKDINKVETDNIYDEELDDGQTSRRRIDLTKVTKKIFRIKNLLIREALAEILSTYLLIIFGCGSVAQAVLSRQNNSLSINISWGFAVTVGILVGGKVSGAQMNPAITFSMLLQGNMSPLKCIVYVVSQSIGAFLGAASVYFIYLDALNDFDGGNRIVSGTNATAGIWATYPQPYLSPIGGFVDQLFGTALLVLIALAVSDDKNAEIPHPIAAIVMGITVALIGMTFGHNCGYAINPARDFMPRVFTSISGWGVQVFKEADYFFWIPIVGPLSGSLISTFIYALFIRNHWPDDKNKDKMVQVQFTKF